MVQLVWVAGEKKLSGDGVWLHQSPLGEVDEETASLSAGEEVDQVIVEVVVENAMSHETHTGYGPSEARSVHTSTLTILAKPM